ncbi:hypothetical protein [Saprospira grandis]|uniref:hypothetical protein n=1 Tax=Saprospira grandis TaxID=1008 RepID=UPI0022DCF224|nr:hypothetical protein [Saprospira grandis]WBM74390.1 hypothetical protein OP864_15500 [Saprospira grandis]
MKAFFNQTEAALVAEIAKAQDAVLLVIGNLQTPNLQEALLDALERECYVEVVLPDASFFQDRPIYLGQEDLEWVEEEAEEAEFLYKFWELGGYLGEYQLNLHREKGALAHNFLILDLKQLFIGDLSNHLEVVKQESALLINDQSIVEDYFALFKSLRRYTKAILPNERPAEERSFEGYFKADRKQLYIGESVRLYWYWPEQYALRSIKLYKSRSLYLNKAEQSEDKVEELKVLTANDFEYSLLLENLQQNVVVTLEEGGEILAQLELKVLARPSLSLSFSMQNQDIGGGKEAALEVSPRHFVIPLGFHFLVNWIGEGIKAVKLYQTESNHLLAESSKHWGRFVLHPEKSKHYYIVAESPLGLKKRYRFELQPVPKPKFQEHIIPYPDNISSFVLFKFSETSIPADFQLQGYKTALRLPEMKAFSFGETKSHFEERHQGNTLSEEKKLLDKLNSRIKSELPLPQSPLLGPPGNWEELVAPSFPNTAQFEPDFNTLELPQMPEWGQLPEGLKQILNLDKEQQDEQEQ